jgi:hypothetical protein
MAIKINNQTVIDDSRNLTNIGTLGMSGGISGTTTISMSSSISGATDVNLTGKIGVGATPNYGVTGQVLRSNGASTALSWDHQKLRIFEYADRNQVRSLTPVTGDQVVIKNLGLFNWVSGSTEFDDDETCFATASGRWLFEGTSTEYEFALSQPDNTFRDLASISELNTIVSVAANTTATQNVTVAQADVNDLVMLDSNFDISFRATATARVINANTVRITVKNHTGTAITISDFAENGELALWYLLIFKAER